MPVNINIDFNGIAQPIQSTRAIADYGLEERSVPVMFGLEPVPQLLYRAKGKGKGKEKNCQKGQVCGASCISKTKTCRANLPPGAKAKGKWAVQKTKGQKVAAGGGGVAETAFAQGKTQAELGQKLDQAMAQSQKQEPGGALVLRPGAIEKIQEHQQAVNPKIARQNEIDKKYINQNIDDNTVKAWHKETVANFKDTSEENIQGIVARRLLFDLASGNIYGEASHLFKGVHDENSYVAAHVALQTARLKSGRKLEFPPGSGEFHAQDKYEYWLANLYASSSTDYENAKSVLSNPRKGEKAKAKAQKIVDQIEKERAEDYPVWARRQWENNAANIEGAARRNYQEGMSKMRPQVEKTIKDLDSKDTTKRSKAEQYFENDIAIALGQRQWGGETDWRAYLTSQVTEGYLGNPQGKAELKKAFKDFALKNHPDLGGDTTLFQTVSARYSKLLENFELEGRD